MKPIIFSAFLLLLLSCNSISSEEVAAQKKAEQDSIVAAKMEKVSAIAQAIKQKEDSIRRIVEQMEDLKKQKLLPNVYKSWITDDFTTKLSFSLTNQTNKTIDVVIFTVAEMNIFPRVDIKYKYVKESKDVPLYQDYRMSIKRIIAPKNKTDLTLEFLRECHTKDFNVTVEKLHFTDGTVSGNY